MRLNHAATALFTIMLLAAGTAAAEAPMPAGMDATENPPHSVLPAAAPAEAPALMPAAVAAPAAPALPQGGNPFRDERADANAAAPAVSGAFLLPPAPAEAAAGKPGVPAAVDERALRYYAAERQLERVAAETKRLKSIYPGWQPPADMFAPNRVGVDEQPLWDIFAKGDYAEVRRQIAARQQQAPSWQPSDELLRKLGQAETLAKLMNAARYGRWNEVVGTAAGSKDLLVCANMEGLWTLGEALARTRQLAESFDVYRYAVVNCPNEQERLATVQKAGLLLPREGRDALIALAAQASSAPAAYEAMRFDPLRTRMGKVAAGVDAAEATGEELQAFATYIEAAGAVKDAELMGWYLYATGSFEAAAAWFKLGMQQGSEPKPTEGYILSLRRLGRNQEAEELAYKNRLRSPEIAKSYFEIVSEQLTLQRPEKGEEGRLAVIGTDVGSGDEAAEVTPYELSKSGLTRFAKFVLEEESALGAQALGWHALKGGEIRIAQDWFDKSVEWGPTEGGVIGTAVVAARLQQFSRLRALKATYEEDYPQLAKFKPGSRSSARNWKRGGKR